MIVRNGEGSQQLDLRDSMYPSLGERIQGRGEHRAVAFSSTFGVVIEGACTLPTNKVAREGEYFCCGNRTETRFVVDGTAVFFERLGFLGLNMVGGPVEATGRLTYIDGCSDTLLVCPPRLGDPSLSSLHFPPHTRQTFHVHPSIRLGAVLRGSGVAWIKNGQGPSQELPLERGVVFAIGERELHRFSTGAQDMVVVAFHPEGDWGPTDQQHSMLNRTYLRRDEER